MRNDLRKDQSLCTVWCVCVCDVWSMISDVISGVACLSILLPAYLLTFLPSYQLTDLTDLPTYRRRAYSEPHGRTGSERKHLRAAPDSGRRCV